MPRRTLLTGFALLLVLSPWLSGADNPAGTSLKTAVAKTADWPQFRGPNRDDVSTDTGLLKTWPKGGPRLLWQGKGAGRGYASLAIANGRIYTMGDGPSTANDKDEYVLCFDAANGKQLWKAKLGPAWNSGSPDWQSSRSTPTVDGELLYVLTAHGELVCLETGKGKERWRKNMRKDFGGDKGDGWGYSESVLVDGDRVVCTPGKASATMVALDKMTGNPIWKASRDGDKGAGHASIVVAEVGGTRVYVNTTASGPFGIRASDGKVLWTYPIDKTTAVIPTPIVRGDLVFFTAGYGRGGALLRQVPTSDGIKVEAVYPLNTKLQNKHGGVVLVGDLLYGDSDSSGRPWCADLMTGKIHWTGKGSGSGSASVTYADGHLYFRFQNGTVALVKASPDGYKEDGSIKIPHSGDRPSWSHPVVTGGKLFLREGDYILCYNLRGK
jgi:outer membrane protein assembly factor BamB